jgi:3'(2'), 5'-bisphosphate nucleotidase
LETIVDWTIDGTKEFIKKKRNGEFTVSCALIEDQVAIGVIFCSCNRRTLFSTKEDGAFKVSVDLENYNVNRLLAEGSKITNSTGGQNFFTIVASRSHMSSELKIMSICVKVLWRKVNLISR